MQAATPAALVRGQLLERFGDETPAVTMLTTTPNDALAHAELVHTYEPPRAVPRASACSTNLSVALALDQVLDDVAFTRREKNVQNRVFNYERYTRHVQGPTPAAKQAAEKAATEQAKATQSTKGAYAGGMDQAGKCPAFPSPRKQENNGLSGEELRAQKKDVTGLYKSRLGRAREARHPCAEAAAMALDRTHPPKQHGYYRTTSRLLEELRVAEAEINEPTETPAQAAQRAANAGCTYAVEELEAKRAELTLLERSCGDATTVDSGLERETSKVRTQLMELQALLRTDIRDVLTLTLYARHHHRPLTPSTSPSRPLAPSPSSPSPRLHRHRHRSNTDVATIYGTTTVPLRELPLLQPVSHRHTSICGAGAGVGDCGAGAGVGDCGAGVGTKPLDCGDADLRV